MKGKENKTDSKNSLLERWLKKRKQKPVSPTDIGRIPDDVLPGLSFGQQRLWFLQQLYPENPFYHYADSYRLKGDLNVENLIRSFEHVAMRHHILRTTFETRDGHTLPVVNKKAEFDVNSFDLSHLSGQEQIKEVKALTIAESRRSFNLIKGPLSRISLIRLGDQDHLLVLTMHHIITDKWSMRILREEVAEFYRQLNDKQAPAFTELPIQYADYAYWQKSRPQDDIHLAYWKKKLSGDLPLLNLPVDHKRPFRPSFKGSFLKQKISRGLTEKLKTLSKKSNTTLFILLLTAFKVLLHRYSGDEDILIGSPFTNRDRSVLEKLIGFFNDTLVLRSDLSGNPRFIDLIEQVRQTSLEAFSHKNTPFETLVQTLKPERYLNVNPIFQVMFLFHNVPETPSFGSDLHIEHQPFDFGVAKFDLTLYVQEEEDGLVAIFEYATDLFEAVTMERMQKNLLVLLETIVHNPNQRIASIPILSAEEKHQVLHKWNDWKTPLPKEKCIHHFFENLAIEKPDQIAVVHKDWKVTYKTLDEQANVVANHLKKNGVDAGAIIGLCTERSLDMVVGLLAILKAGGTFMPIDPEYPLERIHFMMEDANVSFILTQAHLTGLFSDGTYSLFIIDELKNKEVSVGELSMNNDAEDHNAYLIYTSGSVGRPKGVLVSHKNIIHSTYVRSHYYENKVESFLLLSSFAFDSAMVGIFWTLCSGGSLVLPEKRIEQDMDLLASVIEENKVSHTLLLPSLYEVVLQQAPGEKLLSLNTVIVAGEACPGSLRETHFNTLPHVRFYNEYGPSEATVWCTAHELKAEETGPVPIGRPIPNTDIYILDKNLQLLPIGAQGELYVGGPNVSQGYLNRPELTHERFVDHPFSDNKRAKLYRTGDLVRYRSDGLIDFLGRVDHQVKIRGYRIEPDEIKEILKQYPGVSEALVVVNGSNNADRTKDVDAGSIEKLMEIIGSMNDQEAEDLLQSIEMISEDALDNMVAEIEKTVSLS